MPHALLSCLQPKPFCSIRLWWFITIIGTGTYTATLGISFSAYKSFSAFLNFVSDNIFIFTFTPYLTSSSSFNIFIITFLFRFMSPRFFLYLCAVPFSHLFSFFKKMAIPGFFLEVYFRSFSNKHQCIFTTN